MILAEEGHVPAALAHLDLADALGLDSDQDPALARTRRAIEGNASYSAWLRNPYPLAPAPSGLPADQAENFAQALAWAGEGLWSKAGNSFQGFSAWKVPEADRNLAVLRLMVARDDEAVEAAARYVAARPEAEDAVDFEALRQILAPPQGGELVGHVQLIWTMRDRAGLVKRLTDDPSVAAEGPGPIDEADPESPQVEWFALLDRKKSEKPGADLTLADVPLVEARVSIGREIAALDVVDDGRLERLRDRLTDLAGPTLPHAHPRTKTLGPVSRVSTALNVEMWMPEGLGRPERARVSHEQHARIITEIWPATPMPYLGGRTPIQAAKAGDATLLIRSAILQFEASQEFWRSGIDFGKLRSDLGVPPEPAIDPAGLDVFALHLSRFSRVPAQGLDDDALIDLYDRANRYGVPLALEHSAEELTRRPALLDGERMDRVLPFADLANLALSRLAPKEEAQGWITKGRASDPRPEDAPRWDFLDVRLRARTERPQEWVPQLAVLLERYAEDRAASTAVMSNLMEMGLVQMSPNPDDRGQMLLDTRPLQAVLAEYGPKITTASGRLGVSASQAKVWSPESAAGGTSPGGIWTPGSGAAPPTDKPKLIIPGR